MKKLILSGILLSSGLCFASSGQSEMMHRMPNLVVQLGVIIFFARIGAMLAEKCKIPGVLGELLMGILIGPYMFGALPIPGFSEGMFHNGGSFPIQPELYGIAIIASVILLFLSGLETDIALFLKFSFAATIIGIGGIIFSYFFGAYTGSYFLHLPISDPKCMFLGVMSTATSVGITARILSEQKKMDTPEGVTIIAAAVIDDVLGVVIFAVILGISLLSIGGSKETLSWQNIGLLAFKEIGIWLGFTLLGLYFAQKIGIFLKKFKNSTVFSILAFSLALVIAGLFERAGLAMIIGAYVVGFSLSKTEISVSIQEALHPLKVFFVPVFFTVMGMLVDITALFSYKTLIFGLIYTIGAILSKMLGCGFFALFLNFNTEGAKRVGYGMIPRGEVALIIASVGLSYGILNDPNYDIFSIAVFMTLITTLISPPLLERSLKKKISGIKNNVHVSEKIIHKIPVPDSDLNDLICHKILILFKNNGFFISKPDADEFIFQIRRDSTIISLEKGHQHLELIYNQDNSLLIRRIIYETFGRLEKSFTNLQHLEEFKISQIEFSRARKGSLLSEFLKTDSVINLRHDNKESVLWEMLMHLHLKSELKNYKDIYYKLSEQEKKLSSALHSGVAIPHYHLADIDTPLLILGFSEKGLDFNSIDGQKTNIILLMLSPENDADLHVGIISEFLLFIKNIRDHSIDITSKDQLKENLLRYYLINKETSL